MENEGSKKNGKLIGVLIFLFILSLALGSFIIYKNKFAKQPDDKITDNNDNEKTPSDEKDKEKAEIILKSNKDQEDYEYEIRLTADGEVQADVEATNENNNDIVNKTLETQVAKCFIVNVGMPSIGDNRELIFLKKDRTITSISLGDLLINNEIKIKNNYPLKNVTEVYDKVLNAATEYEPANYGVFVKDTQGNETNITDLLTEAK